MRVVWVCGLSLIIGCGPTRFGVDVPLARDCSRESVALSVCDLHDADCALRVFRAVECFHDVDPGEPPPIHWSPTEQDQRARLPKLVWEPPVVEAVVLMFALTTTTSTAPPPRPRVAVFDDPLRVVFREDISTRDPLEQLALLAEGYDLALTLRERPLETWLAPSAEDLDQRHGMLALLFGRASLHASFVVLAATDSALGLTWTTTPPSLDDPGWVETLRSLGGAAVDHAFYAGGDPAVAALLDGEVRYGELGELSRASLAEVPSRRLTPLPAHALVLPEGYELATSFIGGAAFNDFVLGATRVARVRDRVALVDGPDGRVALWARRRLNSADTTATDLGALLDARAVPAVAEANDKWEVLAVGTSTRPVALAQTVLRRLR